MPSVRLLVAALALAAVVAMPAAAATHTVVVEDFDFEPVSQAVTVGDTVHWVWQGATFHSTTSGTCPGGFCTADGTWDSGQFGNGHTFDRQFDTPGTFHYFCIVHGSAMQGDIVVNSTTSATFTVFTARRAHGRVEVAWRTASEVGVLGYTVYRQVGARRIAASKLIVARGGTGGASYRYVDRAARGSAGLRYVLRVVRADGTRTWFGTAQVT